MDLKPKKERFHTGSNPVAQGLKVEPNSLNVTFYLKFSAFSFEIPESFVLYF